MSNINTNENTYCTTPLHAAGAKKKELNQRRAHTYNYIMHGGSGPTHDNKQHNTGGHRTPPAVLVFWPSAFGWGGAQTFWILADAHMHSY